MLREKKEHKTLTDEASDRREFTSDTKRVKPHMGGVI